MFLQGSQLVWSTYLGGTGNGLEYWSRSGFRSSKCLRRGDHQLQRHREQHHQPRQRQHHFRGVSIRRRIRRRGRRAPAPASPAPMTHLWLGSPTRLRARRWFSDECRPDLFLLPGGSGADHGSRYHCRQRQRGGGYGFDRFVRLSCCPSIELHPDPLSVVCKTPLLRAIYTAAATGQTAGSWSTYFGGTGTDAGTGIALDVNQNTYVAGETNSPPPTLQTAKPLAVPRKVEATWAGMTLS